MKMLSIIGSQRAQGNTAKTVEIFTEKLQGLLSDNLEVSNTKIYLGEQKIQVCKGCRICFTSGENHCPLKDDLLVIKRNIDDSDIVIVASPVYVEDVSGMLKNWIDRMAFVCHRPEYFGRAAFIISTSGLGSTNHTLRTMNTALRTWGFSIIGSATFVTGDSMSKIEIQKKFGSKLDKIAGKIAEYNKSKRALSPSFLSLMTFKIQQLYYTRMGDKECLDYKYWENRGWLRKTRTYYTDTEVYALKYLVAKLAGNLVAKLVIK